MAARRSSSAASSASSARSTRSSPARRACRCGASCPTTSSARALWATMLLVLGYVFWQSFDQRRCTTPSRARSRSGPRSSLIGGHRLARAQLRDEERRRAAARVDRRAARPAACCARSPASCARVGAVAGAGAAALPVAAPHARASSGWSSRRCWRSPRSASFSFVAILASGCTSTRDRRRPACVRRRRRPAHGLARRRRQARSRDLGSARRGRPRSLALTAIVLLWRRRRRSTPRALALGGAADLGGGRTSPRPPSDRPRPPARSSTPPATASRRRTPPTPSRWVAIAVVLTAHAARPGPHGGGRRGRRGRWRSLIGLTRVYLRAHYLSDVARRRRRWPPRCSRCAAWARWSSAFVRHNGAPHVSNQSITYLVAGAAAASSRSRPTSASSSSPRGRPTRACGSGSPPPFLTSTSGRVRRRWARRAARAIVGSGTASALERCLHGRAMPVRRVDRLRLYDLRRHVAPRPRGRRPGSTSRPLDAITDAVESGAGPARGRPRRGPRARRAASS